jgi:formylglycine-generating enzyme required for sulfatase activity
MKHRIVIFFFCIGCAVAAFTTNFAHLKSMEVDTRNGGLVVRSIAPDIEWPSPRPIVSFMLGDQLHTSSIKTPGIKITYTNVPDQRGIRGRICFKNTGNDTLVLHNVVPLGESSADTYITGKGNHGLSRTHLFRPGYTPVNVIVPDNAWELGFSAITLPKGKNVVALTRRDAESLKNARRRRFETILYPEGEVTYNLWIDPYTGSWQEGLRLMFQERYLYDVEPGQFDDAIFQRTDLQWFRQCYAVNLMMNWDTRFYDYRDRQFHLQAYLEKMKRLMGGYEVYAIWPTWPALGMDQRNQWDMFRDLPGGYAQLRKLSDLCHGLGSCFFICYNPWDESTRPEESHFDGMTAITKAVNVDGFVLDTRGSSSKELQQAVDEARSGVVMYSEGMAVPVDMQTIVSGRVHNALYYPPMLNLNKLIKPEFAIFRVAEEAREPIHREFNVSFFNGYGTELNSMPPGRFEWSDDQMRYWGKLLRIQRENSSVFLRPYIPLIPTVRDSIYVNRWSDENKMLYTVYNLQPQGFSGNLFEVEVDDGHHFVDLYHHEEIESEVDGGVGHLRVKVEAFNAYELGTNNESSVTAIARLPYLIDFHCDINNDELTFSSRKGNKIRIWAGMPSYEKQPKEYDSAGKKIRLLNEFPKYEGKFVIQAFQDNELLDERVFTVKPGSPRKISLPETTELAKTTPEGMVKIPAGLFACDRYTIGDSFISYPEDLTGKGEKIPMKSYYMDKYPVTNAQYKAFIDATGYSPDDTTNFLQHWENGKIKPGEENFPVIYITLEDAQAYARWAKKRLPTEMEWQYAAQTEKCNEWPWVQKKPVRRQEQFVTNTLSVWKLEGIEPDRCNTGDGALYPVGKYSKGKNAYGLYDLVGCVWQLTSDVYDNTSYRYVMVKGGSYFLPSSSYWYLQGGPRELNFRQYLLRVSPSFERKATVGFRCVKDIVMSDDENAITTALRQPTGASYVELPLGAIKPKGWLKDMLLRQRNGMTSRMDHLYPEVMGDRNGWLGGDGDQWERGPYWIDGLIPMAYILDDKELKDKAQAWIEWALHSQREDGFFGPSVNYENETGLQRNNSEDWWPRMVMLKCLKQYYMATKDERVLTFMTRYFRYQLETLPHKPLNFWTPWAKYRVCDNLHVVYWLYDITGEAFLLELGHLLHTQSHDFTNIFLNGEVLSHIGTIHAVNLAQGVKEPVIYYQKNPDSLYLEAVKKALEDIRHFHGQPQGMYGGDEYIHGNNPTQGAELCSVVELMYSLEEMGRITGDVGFFDHLERIAFNALPTQIADDFMSRQYFQQPNQVMITRHIHNFDINHGETDLLFGLLTGYPCCTANLHQGWPKFTQNLWYNTPDNGIAALNFSPSEVEAVVAGNLRIKIEEDTYYPMDHCVNFLITVCEKSTDTAAFPFHLRIPAWCTTAKIKINDELQGEFPGGTIAVVNRKWNTGDKVQLELPMHIRIEKWHENSVSVTRGPLLYALKIEEQWSEHQFEDTTIYGESYYEVLPVSKWNYGLKDFNYDKADDFFEVVIDNEKVKNNNPWTLNTAPITIRAKAKEIPSWKIYNDMAGPIPYSRMVYGLGVDDLPEEIITLVPYGCTTLRISEFPVIEESRK